MKLALPRPIDIVTPSETLPQKADVVIIGGGIVGASAALVLAERGVSVVLCEKGEIGAEQSSRNWGLCRQTRRHPAEMDLMIKSMDIWQGLAERTGHETGFRQIGCLFTCDTDEEIAKWDEDIRLARSHGVDMKMLGSTETMARLDGLERKLAGAVFTATDGIAEPQHAAPAISAGAAAKGATIATNCAVRGLETSGGVVSGVVTERGVIKCATAVLASGAWSRRFLANMGISLPALNVHTSIQATTPMEGPPDIQVYGSDFGFRKRRDGGWNLGQLYQQAPIVPDSFVYGPRFIKLLRTYAGGFTVKFGHEFFDELSIPRRWKNDETSPFEIHRVLEPAPHVDVLRRAKQRLDRVAPWFRNAKIAYQWTGVIDMLPDELPVMSELDRVPGLILATGFSGHGFGIGPGAGHLVADLVTGDTPITDPKPFKYDRFA
jgi:glycine/D-amino acid oxidase-like deaminating enzyme